MTVDYRVRAWLMTLPGLVEANTPQEVMRMAWAMSGVECSVHDFEAALDRAGIRASQVRDRFRLALPAAPINSYPAR